MISFGIMDVFQEFLWLLLFHLPAAYLQLLWPLHGDGDGGGGGSYTPDKLHSHLHLRSVQSHLIHNFINV